MLCVQSPQAPDSETFLRSPSSFQGLVTPDWSRKLTHPKLDPQTCPPASQGQSCGVLSVFQYMNDMYVVYIA